MMFSSSEERSEAPLLIPPALRPGECIAVVCPAGPPDAAKLKTGLAYLEALGYRTRLRWSEAHANGFLANTDEARAEDLNRALHDPEVRGIVCAWGGYGAMRVLPLIDYAALRSDPKRFFGYSDITALHVALYKECRLATFHGPNAGELGDAHRVTVTSFRAALSGGDPLDMADVEPSKTVVAGQAEGPLIGGNLSLIAALQGTPWALSAKDRILFLEDVHEESYRLDRMLTGLRLGGFFNGVRGVVIGRLSDCGASYGVSAREVMREHLRVLGVPAVEDFPCGHVREKLTLPFGQRVHLDATGATLRTFS